jgi:hypothetical protein
MRDLCKRESVIGGGVDPIFVSVLGGMAKKRRN